MRIKTFKAESMAEGMRLVRESLGDDAVILSTKENGPGSVSLSAAIDDDLEQELEAELLAESYPGIVFESEPVPGMAEQLWSPEAETLLSALDFHSVPSDLSERLVRTALDSAESDPAAALAAALTTHFTFEPLPKAPRRPCMLVGPPGSGKTVTVAKLAARAVLADLRIQPMTTDVIRAGGIDQLAAFTGMLKLDLIAVESAPEIKRAVMAIEKDSSVIIDTAGINPFDDSELSLLADYIVASKAEPVLVLPAGGDARELADIAEIFAGLGVSRLICTRVDVARRLGSVLAAADAANLRLADFSVTPYVGEGMHGVNPDALARLLVRDPNQIRTRSDFDRTEA